MTVADLVIADLVEENAALRHELEIARAMIAQALQQYHESLETIDRLHRRVQRRARDRTDMLE